MSALTALVRRHSLIFFKDKGMFFTSLMTPAILLVLYIFFLRSAYEDSLLLALPAGMPLSDSLVNAVVGGQLFSSLLAVCCVTVAFCSNLVMVQDKVTGVRRDLTLTPVKKSTLALSYYLATVLSTLLVCLVAAGLCFLYLAYVGWYLSFTDILLIFADVVLLVLFGTALSSVINFFLSTQGQISAVGAIVSAGYGFVCGAYIPISQFSPGLQTVVSFLPGTYGTSLLRNHTLQGAYEEMAAQGFPAEAITSVKDAIDCNLYFAGEPVALSTMYLIVGGAAAVLITIYLLLSFCRQGRQ
ncbi:ABC transporter permease [Candidatus Methanomassiliicoccus intestinalis]|uniref:ABC transporter permease n=1 Tax=Candidatus Methanomassiliicoccus intestinalis TaxID=1406512 RepID=UPI0037DDD58D